MYGRQLIVVLLVLADFGQTASTNYSSDRADEEYCFTMDDEQEQLKNFGAETAYQIVKGVDSSEEFFVPNCKAEKIWLLSRAGTSMPPADFIEKLDTLTDLHKQIVENFNQGSRGSLCDQDWDILTNWTLSSNITTATASYLTSQGAEDIEFMARHYRRALSSAIPEVYDPAQFLLRNADKSEQIVASFKAFVEGILGDEDENATTSIKATVDGDFLKPHKKSKTWQLNVERQSQPDSETIKFQHSQPFHTLIEEVTQRLGLKTQLLPTQIDLMWDMCRYEQAWQLETPSPWCVAFKPNHVNVLTYREDLDSYYTTGYGVAANGNIACAAMNDMLTQLDTASGPQVVANFADTTMVQLFLTALGAYRDEVPLRAKNFDSHMNRAWRIGFVSPFASNIVVVKYGCGNATKIMFLHDQTPIEFEWCTVGLCDWSAVKEKYQDFQDKSCSDVSSQLNGGQQATGSSLVMTVLVFITMKYRL